MKPCDICLEKKCTAPGGVGNCETCKKKDECPRKLRATIRMTLKCTQSCSHCCFECSPDKDTHMTVEMAEKTSRFLKNNEVFLINLMGGEIFCNPNWKEILDLLIPQVTITRIVSNGDWIEHEPEFAKYLTKFENCYVSISKDEWHTMKNVDEALKVLKKCDIPTSVPKHKEEEFNIVPVGRGELTAYGGFYSMFGCYCHNPENKYSFLIDEVGDIFKCGFGLWNYTDVEEYIDGGFSKRFKEFNTIFYDTFIPSCASCIRSHSYHNPK